MLYTFTPDQLAWQKKARDFALEEIRPIALRRDQIADPYASFDWNIIRRGSKLGFRTAAAPKAYGGHGIDFVTQVLVMAELARGDSAISKAFSQNWKWSHLIAENCTPEQKERFLKPFIEDDAYLLGSASTEPNAGSDNRYPPEDDPRSGWRLKAERQGQVWLLNGEKTFIANGSVGRLFFVSARTDPDAPLRAGTTVFMVPADTPGFRVGKIFNKSGWRFYQNAELVFENARVPHANIVGAVNGGTKVRGGAAADFGDLELAANAVGVCDAAVESAWACARREKRGGRRLLDQQLVQLKLNRMHVQTEALRSFALRSAAEMDQGVLGSPSAVLVMNFASDVIQEVTRLNLEIHGAAGGVVDAAADKLVRDSIIWTHLAGDATQRLKVVRRLAGEAAKPARPRV